jgi:hypothetical protein
MSIIYCHKHDHHFDSDEEVDCPQCESECEDCNGTGELLEDVLDPDSGRYMRGVGVKKCHCQLI